jgi:hypothetical protein
MPLIVEKLGRHLLDGVAAALCGIPLIAAWSTPACAKVSPPLSLIAFKPSAPSLPVPERMMQTAFSP